MQHDTNNIYHFVAFFKISKMSYISFLVSSCIKVQDSKYLEKTEKNGNSKFT